MRPGAGKTTVGRTGIWFYCTFAPASSELQLGVRRGVATSSSGVWLVCTAKYHLRGPRPESALLPAIVKWTLILHKVNDTVGGKHSAQNPYYLPLVSPSPVLLYALGSKRDDSGRGDDTVGNPHRAQISQFESLAQISQFELFVLILLVKLDRQFPVERFEAAVSQSTAPSPHPYSSAPPSARAEAARGHERVRGELQQVPGAKQLDHTPQ